MTARSKTVGIIGAGQMGGGIAHVCALAGYKVLLYDMSRRAHRDRASRRSAATWPARSRSGKIDEDGRAGGARRASRPAPAMADLADADLVIEAATEDETVKRKIFAQLCPQLKPEAILATNTSSISITRLASADRPAGALHRHPLHEPGAGDEAGRAGARHRHRRRDLRGRQGLRRHARQDDRPCRRISRPSSSTASCCR